MKCVLPWIHIAVKTDGSIRPCCISDFSLSYAQRETPNTKESIFKSSLQELGNSKMFRSIREDMTHGIEPKECQVCYQSEKRGTTSKRMQENAKWQFEPSQFELKYLDLRFNSQCNLKCVMCSLAESSSWQQDTLKFRDLSVNPVLKDYFSEKSKTSESSKVNMPFFWSNLKSQLPNIEEIYFAGGEPLLQKDHQKCLDLILENGLENQIRLVYNTNGTFINDSVIQQWKKFKSVQINFSLDAFGEKNDFIRFPSKWSHILFSLELLDQSPENIKIRITTTVQVLNVFYLKELIAWKADRNFRKIQNHFATGDIDLNILYSPSYLCLQSLSEYQKQLAAESIQSAAQGKHVSKDVKSKLLGLIPFMNERSIEAEAGRFAFREYMNLLHSERGMDYKSIFPLLGDSESENAQQKHN